MRSNSLVTHPGQAIGAAHSNSLGTVEPYISGKLRLSLWLSDKDGRFWNPARELAAIRHAGNDSGLPGLAFDMRSALAPMDATRLRQRLGMLGSAMAPNRAPEEAASWLLHMERNLADLPENILEEAITEHVRKSSFPPSVAELQAIGAPLLAERKLAAKRLDELAGLADGSFQPAPHVEYRPDPNYCSPEEAAAILKEVGFASIRTDRPAMRPEPRAEQVWQSAAPRKPTRQDYLDMGVSPETLARLGMGGDEMEQAA